MAATGDRSGAARRELRQSSADSAAWSFRVDRDRAAVGRFNDALERELRAQVPEAALRAVQVALDELLTNVIMHAEQAAGPMEVAVCLRAAALETEISYLATAFDPTAWEPAPPDTSVSTARIGGRGLLLVRALMDEFAYRYDDGRNVVCLRKRC